MEKTATPESSKAVLSSPVQSVIITTETCPTCISGTDPQTKRIEFAKILRG